ncbi:MAG: anaerobic selenocysteine-containing dehydrogenase [Myxococcota bacterium]|jgi:anaerobic selenocysteine-containing dehydrogenase
MTATSWKTTACILCECNCGIEVQLGGEDGRRLLKFRGDRAHPTSRGYACEKPHRLDYYQNRTDRLMTPQRRRSDGTYESVSWDVAITDIAARLGAVRDTHGGETIFYYGGGGQGNHLPGAYATATRRVFGSRYRSSALAQEKTGEFWVSERMLGTFTRSDFEHCDVAIFLGKNPWHSHSIARARVTLKEIAKDPARTLIVVDPRVSETAAMADIHLQVRPGCDAWLVAALAAILVEEELLDDAFVSTHTEGYDTVRAALVAVPVADFCARAGIDEALVRKAARVIGHGKRVASFEDLGVQMNRHSTLTSYLHRFLWLLTGNLGKKGTQYVPTPLLSIAGGESSRKSPVVGARIIGGMIPCNVIAEEVLADHDKRYRAMIIEAANPAHSLADSPKFRAAMAALDVSVVIDVAMTETARLADFVLPAATQFEKAEATFFNFEFPENYFQLRAPLMAPPVAENGEGPLPEAEIHARLVEASGGLTSEDLAPLYAAAEKGRLAYAQAFFQHVASNPRLMGLAPVILYRTLGPVLPEGLDQGAVLWGLALRCAAKNGPSLARAGFQGPPPVQATQLFEAILAKPSGFVFAVDRWEDVMDRVGGVTGKIQLALPDLLAELATLSTAPEATRDPAFPFILSAGERRSFTANTIIRNPDWRKRDIDGALRICPDDAASLGLIDGGKARVTTKTGSTVVSVEVSTTMQPRHVSLPNGLGLDYPGPVGGDNNTVVTAGISPNELTALEDRDPFVGTPWHKHVPARVEAVA